MIDSLPLFNREVMSPCLSHARCRQSQSRVDTNRHLRQLLCFERGPGGKSRCFDGWGNDHQLRTEWQYPGDLIYALAGCYPGIQDPDVELQRGVRFHRQYHRQYDYPVGKQPSAWKRVLLHPQPNLDANNWFNNGSGIPVSPQRWNVFGGSIGGPIKHNRTFFFADYDALRSSKAATSTFGVPSAAERAGNFGELCGYNGGSFDLQPACVGCRPGRYGTHIRVAITPHRGSCQDCLRTVQQYDHLCQPGQSESQWHRLPVIGSPGRSDGSGRAQNDAVLSPAEFGCWNIRLPVFQQLARVGARVSATAIRRI